MESMREGDLVADRYRLGARIGRGAMGQVFAARDERLQRDVAVKLVDLGATADRTVAERFHREAIATASLNHPNIVTIFDADTEGQTAYIVMELLEGRPLSQLVREQGPLPLADAVRIAGQVARALVATHRIGVVHRDIKPANIMIDGRSVKLLDFGIALVSLDAEANLTAPATTLGTAAYMSPEQARGERATAASDVYALGGVLMVMLTGHAPFPGDNAVAVLHQQITDRAPLVSSRRPDAPPTLDDLVARMLAKDPAHRPTSDEVVTALAPPATVEFRDRRLQDLGAVGTIHPVLFAAHRKLPAHRFSRSLRGWHRPPQRIQALRSLRPAAGQRHGCCLPPE